jgi:hypothetical protein
VGSAAETECREASKAARTQLAAVGLPGSLEVSSEPCVQSRLILYSQLASLESVAHWGPTVHRDFVLSCSRTRALVACLRPRGRRCRP